jgi:hypothetical protein
LSLGKDGEEKIGLEDHLSNPMRSPEEPKDYLSYILVVSVVAIAAYLVFHNKQKVNKFY